MRRLFVLVLIAACHAPAPARTTDSRVDESLLPPELRCPRRSFGPTPEIIRRDSLALAKPHLESAVADGDVDIDGLAAAKGPAFFVPVRRGSIHGSASTVYDVAGVFVMKSHVVVVKKVYLKLSVIPGSGPPPIDYSRIEVLSPTIGHIQVVGAGRVIDHFIDLELTRHLLAVESSEQRTWTLYGDSGPITGDCWFYWDD